MDQASFIPQTLSSLLLSVSIDSHDSILKERAKEVELMLLGFQVRNSIGTRRTNLFYQVFWILKVFVDLSEYRFGIFWKKQKSWNNRAPSAADGDTGPG